MSPVYPQRIQSAHVESIDGELCVYDTARQRVHSLNHTAAFVWQRCDGRTAPADLAAALSAEASIDDAEAVVQLTLQELAAAQLLAAPLDDVAVASRRDLLMRGIAAASIPAIYSIVAPTPAAAQSVPPPGAPTLTSVSPNQGSAGTTVPVTLNGTNFVVGATTVTVNSGGVTATNVIVASATSLTADIVMTSAATVGAHTVTVTTSHGTSGAQTFTVNAPAPVAPTLTSVSPNSGTAGTTVAVTLTGTNFVVGATTVTVNSGGVTATNVIVASATSLTADIVMTSAATIGAHTVTVTTSHGTSGAQAFTVNPPPPPPTLTSVSPNQGTRGTTVAVTLTGTNFVVAATTVAVSGGGVTVNNVVVGSGTSLSADFVLDGLATDDLRAVTVTTPGGTSGAQTFLILLPHGVELFAFTGVPRTFIVPAGVTSIVIEAIAAKGGDALPIAPGVGGVGGGRGKVDATVSVTPGSTLTVRVGGDGQAGADGLLADGGFNGGGRSGERGGGGGGASDVYNGAIPLVIAGGGGGSGYKASGGGGNGGDGGGITGRDGEINPVGGLWGSGGGQLVGGAGGAAGGGGGTPGTAGSPGMGGIGGQLGLLGGGGGGGGGGYRGGGGGGGGTPGGGGGGGGSSLATPGATHVQGSSTAAGVKITW